MSDGLDIVKQVFSHNMRNSRYSVLVRPFLLGQYRIQLTDVTMPDLHAPDGHGSIVRECCTYDLSTVRYTVLDLILAPDPVEYLRSLETDDNCEDHGRGRIRLDTKQ